jgi:ppGpp synthetase/RelA/SpoT-type nucleotidyltranferase
VEKHLSNAQIDRLGDRLRRQDFGEAELRLLDEFRRTFGPAYDLVVERIQQVTAVSVSGRPAKSTTSIIEKLKRESIRLSQVQDIAGCRAVVEDLAEQDRVVAEIAGAFEASAIVDRRVKPSHGYRAVHIVVRENKKPIEIQIRTALQHVWAELCEKLADAFDPAIKYGGGPGPARDSLDHLSRAIGSFEKAETALIEAGPGTGETGQKVRALAQQLREQRSLYLSSLQSLVKKPVESD